MLRRSREALGRGACCIFWLDLSARTRVWLGMTRCRRSPLEPRSTLAPLNTLRRSHQLIDEVEKCPGLGRNAMPRRIVGIERKPLVRPIRKQVDQAPLGEEGRGAQEQHLRNPETREAGIEQCAGVVDGETAARVDGYAGSLAMELPGKRLAGFRFAEFEAAVIAVLQVLRLFRAAPAFEIRGRGHRDDGGVQKLACDQRRGSGLAESQGEVEACL